MVGLIQVQTNVLLNPLSYRVFDCRAGRAGSERTRFRVCLVGGWDGWVGSRVEYSSQMRVGLVHQNLADGAAPAGLSGSRARTPNGVTSHVSNSFNQILDVLAPSPKSKVQPNTRRIGYVPKNWVGSNPTHPTPNQTHTWRIDSTLTWIS